MSLVVDASVAVKWFLPEDGSGDALALKDEGIDLIAPATALYEIYHAVWHADRTGRARGIELARMPELLSKTFSVVAPIEPLFLPAAGLAAGLPHPIYDCLYLALAQREHAAVVTADERLFAAARKARIKARRL
jgi:predicted nucleic acid-binding protein